MHVITSLPSSTAFARSRSIAARVAWFVVPSFLAALPVLLALFGGPEVKQTRPDLLGVVVWFVLLVVAESHPVPLPRGGTITIASVLDVGAILLFGPWVAGALDLLTAIPAQLFLLRERPAAAMLNGGIYASTTILAGSAYLAAGGALGAPRLHDFLPILIAGALYYAVNTGWVSLLVGANTQESPRTIWRQQFRDGLLQHALAIGFGLLFAQVRVVAGIPGVLLLTVPLFLARYALRLYADLREDLVGFVRALSTALDAVDPYTHRHSVRVAGYSVRVARHLALPESEVEMIHYAALVHDIGKIAQRPDVIRKPTPLTEEERLLMMRHPEAGAKIVEQIRALRSAAEMVRTHHWRPDGQGYPSGLTEAEVPLGARIIHVCDAFDAMTSDRSYRRGLPVACALAELSAKAGTEFDEEIVAALVQLHEGGALEGVREAGEHADEIFLPEAEPEPR
ncbi:MAG TPA: HD-GYP domain-containing protein [Candidatus Binatia bacterium]|nr:HD-GYP domain-containing protein [Candidatus Binatia bacterium]